MEKLKEKSHAKSHVERVLTYVEKQLSRLQTTHATLLPTIYVTFPFSNNATQPHVALSHGNPAHGTPFLNSSTIARLDIILAESHKARVIKISDPLKFYRKPVIVLILYKDWLLQI